MIPQTDPRASLLEDRDKILGDIASLVDSGAYILGSLVQDFEKDFARYLGVGFCTGVANGTDAIEIALLALGVTPGDLVATVSHTAVATVNAIVSAGAQPLWVDIDPLTGLMSLNDLEQKIIDLTKTPNRARLRGIVIVHLYGNPVDLRRARAIADAHQLFLLEDCAQAHGARFDDLMVGSIGDGSCFSFYPTKNLPALGDAGAVVTNSSELNEKISMLRQYGWRERYVSEIHGKNSRLDPIQAIVLKYGLAKIDERNARRRDLAASYLSSLQNLKTITALSITPTAYHVFHQFVIKTKFRDELKDFLYESGVSTLIHYPRPVHSQAGYQNFSNGLPLPVSDSFANQILSLPMFPQLAQHHVEFIVTKLVEFDRQHA